jgi:hypothetical protein
MVDDQLILIMIEGKALHRMMRVLPVVSLVKRIQQEPPGLLEGVKAGLHRTEEDGLAEWHHYRLKRIPRKLKVSLSMLGMMHLLPEDKECRKVQFKHLKVPLGIE